ncbi:RcnB family protein [Xylophilus sp.]|uniref:RcnB family protein n=1 Tax=Xylophilus sp. TaxID=2653893 RepID=UPI0013B90615|nr:RcnB family protein [Xylophilus sp.]KAF1046824.1 MAG: hypothetical protein GAK38_02223 [Xylophilus sp.]
MKKMTSLIVSAALAATSLGAVAQPAGPNDQRQDGAGQQQPQQRGGDNGHQQHTSGPSQQQQQQPARPQQANGGPQDQGVHRGRDFHKGERLPTEYRNRQHYVDDWRAHGLKAPPKGHRWVQVGSDYVLVAVATGVIASILNR